MFRHQFYVLFPSTLKRAGENDAREGSFSYFLSLKHPLPPLASPSHFPRSIPKYKALCKSQPAGMDKQKKTIEDWMKQNACMFKLREVSVIVFIAHSCHTWTLFDSVTWREGGTLGVKCASTREKIYSNASQGSNQYHSIQSPNQTTRPSQHNDALCDIRRDCCPHFASEWDFGRDARRAYQAERSLMSLLAGTKRAAQDQPRNYHK